MKADPKVRPNCAQCGKPRHPERSRKYAKGQAEADPFCSTVCARAWHGNPLPAKSIWGVHHGLGPPPPLPPEHGTVSRYGSPQRCRCAPCKAASAAAKKAWRDRKETAA